jgi:hypothetical protein
MQKNMLKCFRKIGMHRTIFTITSEKEGHFSQKNEYFSYPQEEVVVRVVERSGRGIKLLRGSGCSRGFSQGGGIFWSFSEANVLCWSRSFSFVGGGGG